MKVHDLNLWDQWGRNWSLLPFLHICVLKMNAAKLLINLCSKDGHPQKNFGMMNRCCNFFAVALKKGRYSLSLRDFCTNSCCNHAYVCGGLPFAADTRDPHSNSSLLVSSLWQITSMKQKASFIVVLAVVIAVINSASFATWHESPKETDHFCLLWEISNFKSFSLSESQRQKRELVNCV